MREVHVLVRADHLQGELEGAAEFLANIIEETAIGVEIVYAAEKTISRRR